jgi:hypothetical protein
MNTPTPFTGDSVEKLVPATRRNQYEDVVVIGMSTIPLINPVPR